MATITHPNLDDIPSNPAVTQAIKVTGPASLVFIGGQNGVDADGNVVGDDAASQAEQALRNVERALLEAPMTPAEPARAFRAYLCTATIRRLSS